MSQSSSRTPVPPSRNVFKNLGDEIRLVMRLLADPRVPWYLKVLPFGSLAYFLFPDLAPGPIDDAIVIGIGVFLFIELCPPHVVAEHRAALRQTVEGQWREPEVIEGQYTDTPEDEV
ncbi:MAG: hypothetical protein D6803_00170 [Anaerolineae bacterium]|nr:MAG: hypothetical protein D6803_00170 [Anaerolineae bacterium]